MSFNPIIATKNINDTYKNYMKSTFYIRDEELRNQYFEKVDELNFANGPYLDCVDSFEFGKSLKDFVTNGLISNSFEALFKDDKDQYERKLYKHQEIALNLALEDKNLVVTTGTGSGKTECFVYPMLNYLLTEESKGTLGPGVRVLLLYPMNALANDQMKRLRHLLRNTPFITFGSYTGETEETYGNAFKKYKTLHNNQQPLKNELISREQMKESPPNILVTNYAMLEYLLIRPKDNVFFGDSNVSKYWKYIVLDEAHVYSGASGMEVSILLRRLFHKLPDNKKIRWILTSATLGEEENNEDIIKFASSLCASQPFSEDSIIRAKRKVVVPTSSFTGTPNLYEEIVNIINNKEDDETILKNQVFEIFERLLNIDATSFTNESFNINRIIFDIFSKDSLYGLVRKAITNKGAVLLEDLISTVGFTKSGVVDFIQIANFGIKNKGKLLDSRYHHFIRTLEGAYVSFYPKKSLSLIPIRTVTVSEEKYKAFKLSVCQYCGELYLEGDIKEGFLKQEDGNSKKYFMIIDEKFLEYDEDDSETIIKKADKIKRTYQLCSKCGSINKYSSAKKCSCHDDAQILIYEPAIIGKDKILHKCGFCKFVNTKGSVIRGFYLGQDGSTSVVAESLYEEIPEVEVKEEKSSSLSIQRNNRFTSNIETKKKKTKRLLIFSDSRQEAAYFATYFQYTYEIVYRRRLMMNAARELLSSFPTTYESGIPLNDLAEKMYEYFTDFNGVNNSPTFIRKEVWKTIINEFKDQSRNSLHSIGWLEYELDSQSKIKFDYENENIRFDIKEINSIAKFILRYCVQHGAIDLPTTVISSMTEEDWGFFEFSKKEPVIQEFRATNNYSVNARTLVSDTQNSISDYLDKVFKMEKEDIISFITDMTEHYFKNENFGILVPSRIHVGDLKVNPNTINVLVQGSHEINHFQCNICGKITTINIKGKCPAYRCQGTLHNFNFEETDTKNYFIGQYGENAPTNQIVIKEHTAQLNHEKAQEYQQKFVKGDINILSCTTTFEMGVDVGELETVFMKNVPPKPSNYIQRAGRAGRRISTSAFSLTFCRLSPHDFYYFKTPKSMINGTIEPPIFKIDNSKIVRRHVFAILLAAYWKELFFDKTKIEEFFEESSFSTIIKYLENIPTSLSNYINDVVPHSIKNQIPNFIDKYKDQLLPRVRSAYLNDISEYAKAIKEEDSKDKKNYNTLKWLDRIKTSYQNESLLTYYSRNNLIPKYGFPVDTVTLYVNALSSSSSFKDDSSLDLQRDLIQAISDYAPDSEVIADGNLYKSRYIKLPFRKDELWKPQTVHICANNTCGKIEITPYKKEKISGKTDCSSCGLTSVIKKVMLIPSYGFIIEPNVTKATTKRPTKSPKTEFYYLGTSYDQNKSDLKAYSYGDVNLSIVSSMDNELLIMNKLNFYVCESCGYSEIGNGGPTKQKAHKTHRGRECTQILNQRILGHKFKTDVVLISIDKVLKLEKALSILYALLEGCSKYFDVARDDIDGCISYQSYTYEGAEKGTTFILFDSVPGGAGNVKRIYEANKASFDGFITTSYNRVNDCDCGEDGDSVCYKCLCNFKNQHYQDKMERRYARDFLEALIPL